MSAWRAYGPKKLGLILPCLNCAAVVLHFNLTPIKREVFGLYVDVSELTDGMLQRLTETVFEALQDPVVGRLLIECERQHLL